MKEPGREKAQIAGPFQVSKLQTFACSQGSGKGRSVRIETRPVNSSLRATLLASPPQEREGRTPCSPHTGDTAVASPMPPIPQHHSQRRVSCLPGQTQKHKRVIPQMHTSYAASPESASALGGRPCQGRASLESPAAPPDPASPSFSQWFFLISPLL